MEDLKQVSFFININSAAFLFSFFFFLEVQKVCLKPWKLINVLHQERYSSIKANYYQQDPNFLLNFHIILVYLTIFKPF